MKRTMITWMLAGTLLATTAAACGSDEEKDEKPASTEAVSDDGGDSGESSGNAEVDEYCQAAEDLAAELAVGCLWATARVRALGLYRRSGWVVVGPEWDKPGVGPHRYVIRRISARPQPLRRA